MAVLKAMLSIPNTVGIAHIRVVPTPPTGRIKLLRSPDDANPIVVTGTHQDVRIDLAEPCTIYYEFFPETTHVRIYTMGWEDPGGPPHFAQP